MRNTIESFNGKLVKNTGDGVLAVFDGPARSIESAMSSIEKLKEIELKIRCSLHVGEVVWRNDDITGIAVPLFLQNLYSTIFAVSFFSRKIIFGFSRKKHIPDQ